ncbi:MAG: DNA repair protein RecN [Coriobacteriia bacterium]|nr:DNA repair protein RecN [Coriobacteriia bacterium]MBS5478243.1 DNA repair protein RecN [Coriobacteriia bacterium]
MLDELHVSNLALISDATLVPGAGLTVLTGETGAGKSALLSAIKLLIGERASGDAVRDGAEGLVVEGRFFLRADGDACPDGHVASRRVSAEGRSRCSLDGAMATVAQLADVVGSTVDLCGQHDHQRLLSPANHLPLLDAWAGESVAAARASYEQAFDARRRAAAELDRVLAARSEEASRVEEARFTLARIDEVAPQPGEYEELEASLPRLQNAEALASAANAGYEALSSDGGALDAVNAAISALEGVRGYDAELGKLADALTESTYGLEDASRELRRYRDDVDFDPEALARATDRMGELTGLLRSFGPRMEDVLAKREEAAALVALVDDSEELERKARAALDQADEVLTQAAAALTQARSQAAPRFAAEVSAQMGRLEMAGAELIVDVAELPRAQWGRHGADRVEFLYRPGAGLASRPFAKIASGGEVSRVMLSIKVALGGHDDVETLVFDEIDTGVGGSTARAVAAVLADLARTHQVIVVTHLAQIAVFAQRHYVVSKGLSPVDGRNETRLVAVEGEQRVREVSRMLSGDVDDASLEHARRLLAQASAEAAPVPSRA